MSHEIETAVFSAREGAGWTGLGQGIPAAIANDPAKIAELLGATWTVQAEPVYVRNAQGGYDALPNTAAQLRSDTRGLLSVTSETKYHTDNRQPIDVLEAFRDDLAKHSLEISHAAVLKGGQIIAVSALLDPSHDLMIGKGDRVQRYLTLSTGYDKKHGTPATEGGIRVVCKNTLAMSLANYAKKASLKASQKFEVSTLKDLIQNLSKTGEQTAALYNELANTALSDADVSRYFADVLEINIEDLGKVDTSGKSLIATKSRNMLTAMANAYRSAPGAVGASGNIWGALNAVTYYATHEKTVRDTSGDGTDAARTASNMFGDSARLKARALALAQSRIAVAA